MSILDDAIREHLELKRSHGADESELKRLEDEAFGPAERPGQGAEQVDPFAEAPTEFLTAPEVAPDATSGDPPTGGRPIPNVADLQEPPPPPKPVEPEENAEDAATDGPAVEEHPAMEHEAIVESEAEPEPAGEAEERSASAEQPTELFDVEGQFADTAEVAGPSDEELVDAEQSEPRLGPVDPLADIEASGEEVEVSGPAHDEHTDEFDEFFSEQRLSDELNQALEAPLPDEPGGDGEGDGDDEPEAAEPGHVDALEDTPEFLEETPEDDDAWFEQKPPKDFDFGD
jgi:hypothetical protein